MKPLALYIHVPFCGRRCSYCHFEIKVLHPRTPRAAAHGRYLAALKVELTGLAAAHAGRPLHSVFLGGGTPSQLGAALTADLLDHLRACFPLTPDCEISMEINPEDADGRLLPALQAAGVNRISFGVQSFHDPSLRAVGRPHTGAQALRVLRAAPRFAKGLSLDLILGLPHQTADTLAADLDHLLALDPPHVSLYMLERDLPTPLDKQADRLPMPDEDAQAGFYETVTAVLGAAGYDPYEISNFAKPGYMCRHNLTYWHCGDYLAAGPAAVGRVGLELRAGHARLADWLAAVDTQGHGVAETETWAPARLHQERLVQGMRLREGVPADWLDAAVRERLTACFEAGLLTEAAGRVALTARGRLLGNEVFAAFVEDP